ncbi:MobA/MobL family protein [Shimia sp. R9_3]|nr:MobA/MobL family protein [Shimia sp. R9_3]
MIHPASRLEVVVHSRTDGRSAVKSAAYTARTSYRDERLGQRFRAGKRGGLLSHELINWSDDAEALWNAAERAEVRRNARVIRELRPSLPAELPLAEQVRLVRGISLWLRDEYGVAVQADIHAPRFFDRGVERRHNAGKLSTDSEEYLAALFDPMQTNRNFHAHILLTTRKVCPETGEFSNKTRILDDKKTGPEEVLRIRQEWQKRTNAALKRIGSPVRVDLRSYEDMAKAGDAPAGLIPQDHLGPRRAERSRRLKDDGGDISTAAQRRAEVREHNDGLWRSWLQLRALQREQDRMKDSARIAAEREAERKEKADAEKRRLQNASTAAEAEETVEASAQFDSVRTASMWEMAISSAQAGVIEPSCEQPDEFSSEVDLEVYDPPPGRPQPEPVLTPRVVRVRRRGHRHR